MSEAKERSELRLFLNYRRDDSAGFTGRLFDSLSAVFNPANIFMDIDSIPAGVMFNKVVRQAIADADVVLVIMGRRWEGTAPDGSRRLDSRDDFVRSEVAAAIEMHKRIIPVLVDGAQPLPAGSLPADIAPLAFANAIELTHLRWSMTPAA